MIHVNNLIDSENFIEIKGTNFFSSSLSAKVKQMCPDYESEYKDERFKTIPSAK